MQGASWKATALLDNFI